MLSREAALFHMNRVLVPSTRNFTITREMFDRFLSFFKSKATKFHHDHALKYDDIRDIHDSQGVLAFIAEKIKALEVEIVNQNTQNKLNYLQMNAKLNQQKAYYYAAFGYFMMGEVPDELALELWCYFRDENTEQLLKGISKNIIEILKKIKQDIISYSSDNVNNIFKTFFKVGHYFYKAIDKVSKKQKAQVIALIKFVLYQYGLFQLFGETIKTEAASYLMLKVPAILEGSNKPYTNGGKIGSNTLGCETNVRRYLCYALGKVKNRKNAKPRVTRKRKINQLDEVKNRKNAKPRVTRKRKINQLDDSNADSEVDSISSYECDQFSSEESDQDDQEIIDILLNL